MKLVLSKQIFERYSNIKFHENQFSFHENPSSFHENPFIESRVAPCGRLYGTDGRSEMTKLIVALRNFAKVPPKML